MRDMLQNKKKLRNSGVQCRLLVAHWLLAPGDHGSNLKGEEKIASFIFELRSHDLLLT